MTPLSLSRIAACAAPLLLALAAGTAQAQVPAQAGHGHHDHGASAEAPTADAAGMPLSTGEVTRWDVRTRKLTLRHGELLNLGMPAMTMVFTLQHAEQGQGLQPGDQVRFHAEDVNGALVITHLEAVR